MGRRGQSVTLSISESDKAHLEALALEFGMTWGDRPNISRLVEAIAQGQLVIAPNHDWPRDRIQALNRARTALIDAGEMDAAIAISTLLLERSELTMPLRHDLQQFVARPSPSWRREIDTYIHRQQPFQLSYQDAAERIWQFTVRYVEIARHEDRQYLDCWCEETDGNQDLPELQHNWCLRIDRITDAAIAPVKGAWRDGFSSVPVEMHLFNRLAFAYRSKHAGDIANEWLTDPPQVRRVVRQVTHSFWFIREVLRYGQDCEVISPDAVRDRIKQEIQKLYARYHP